VIQKLKDFAQSKRVRMEAKPSLRDLSVLMKQAPQYQKELSHYSAHFGIAESCMTMFNKHVGKLCAVEQVLRHKLINSASYNLYICCCCRFCGRTLHSRGRAGRCSFLGGCGNGHGPARSRNFCGESSCSFRRARRVSLVEHDRRNNNNNVYKGCSLMNLSTY